MIRKEYAAHGNRIKAQVKFTLPNSLWADKVYLVGDFNAWNRTSHPMQRELSGEWSTTVELGSGHAYQFRYLRDNHEWLNDPQADAFVCNPYGSDNFVVVVDPMFSRHCDKRPQAGYEQYTR